MLNSKISKPIARFSPFARALLTHKAIDFLLPGVIIYEAHREHVVYETTGLKAFTVVLNDSFEEILIHYLRQIVNVYYDLAEEYFIPSTLLSLDPADIWVDKKNRLRFMLTSNNQETLLSLVAELLGSRWREEMEIPREREGWYQFLDTLEDDWQRRNIFVHPPVIEKTNVPDVVVEKKKFKFPPYDDKRLVFIFWGLCLMVGILLGWMT